MIIVKKKRLRGYAMLSQVHQSVIIVNVEKNLVTVKNYNMNPLPYAEGFWNNNPIIHGKRVIALQNITDQ